MFIPVQYDGLPVKIDIMNIKNFPWHIHKDPQMIYVLRGEIELKHVFTHYHLKKDDIHIIHRDDIHGLKGISDDNLIVFLSFDVKHFQKRFPTLNYQIFSGRRSNEGSHYPRQPEVKSCLLSMISTMHAKSPGYESRVEQLACDMLDIMYADFRSFMVNRNDMHYDSQDAGDIVQLDRIGRVLSYIYANYPYKLSLADIAEQEGLSTYYLSHLFQNMMGDSFRNFVSMARVEMSEVELLTTNNSISLISQHMGFSNAKYYVENFKYWFGCHPRDHRLQSLDKIIGNAPVLANEISFESLLKTLDVSDQKSVFSGESSPLKITTLDLKNAGITLRSLTNQKDAVRRQYENYDPHSECLALLKKYLKKASYEISSRPLYDIVGSTEGLLTINGLKKPIFWLQKLLRGLYSGIAQSSEWHLITASGSNIQILFFNQGTEPQDFEFNFFNMAGNYQITEHHIRRENCCTDLWRQLNFRISISEAERQQINAQCTPDVSFKSVISSGTFTYSQTLAPGEIVFTEAKRL
ncbi:MAG: helix-turn-helix transcriptional regulator [Firmicutes bacterium]|nr:helix-turn-helix transcriptional regulator [Bacillota bacterium]